ncbi:lysostaphin resistance A-like protein [Nostoc sp. CCY0012]|uniref:CPBP family intramembrane glutamic endopeptidase n=1 Tax=Nostoc sp. CCY0012 TaxID=1056123 RepID=UPI0039C5DCDA
MTPDNLDHPFRKLKVRNLFLQGLLISFILGIALGFGMAASGITLNNQVMPLILYILIFGLLCLWILSDFNRLGINLQYVVGTVPRNYRWLPIIGLVFLLILFSLSAYLVSFSLLSWVAPDFVEELMRQVASNPTPQSSAPLLNNVLAAIATVVVAPIAEEFIFRGVILQRWAAKWGIRTALISSSLLFGVLHANIVGLSMFGIMMGVLYIKTRTLIVPIVCHAVNNLLAVSMGFFASESQTTSAVNNLEQLRSSWWVGVVLMLISLPLLMRFLSRNWPRKNTAIPYLVNASPAEM